MRPAIERSMRLRPAQGAFNRAIAGRLAVGCLVLGSALSGCMLGCEKATSDAPSALEPCKEVGQRCEYAPGKLGACVLRDGCQGDRCFVCQSQH
jgi:hypothetical protein